MEGLSSAQVQNRLQRGQTNNYVQKTSRSAWSILKANMFTLFNGIIGVCFVILLIIGNWQDIFFALSALTNTIISSIQELRAKRTLDKLALLNAQPVTVIRNGKEQSIAAAAIVIDDLLILRAGDEVAADAKIITSSSLQIDQSMLTGEADPIDKKRGSEILSGSIVVAGNGYARVKRVGENSFANRFASDARRFSLVASELRNSINKVLTFIAWTIGPLILLVLNSQIIAAGGWGNIATKGVWQHAMVSTVASIVAMIPLGLVLITSISFALGAVKLARQKVLVKELAAVEVLARVDMICLDKTGTLTEGAITFQKSYELSGHSSKDWKKVLAWYAHQPSANATTRSLRAAYQTIPTEPSLYEIQFSSIRKWSAVSFGVGTTKGSWVLGGPEILFPDDDSEVSKKTKQLTKNGQRVLVLAYSAEQLDMKKGSLPANLQPYVLLSFQEAIRNDAAATLAYFKEQGVDVCIISGDSPNTVAAIARKVGLTVQKGYDARYLPKDEVALAKVLRTYRVFGRVSPEQKLQMITTLQTLGHTVAMIGDGVNDTLSIKQADIGIAMNTGSAAAKAVSRLVLIDGQFSHLPGVVQQGRQVIANIEHISMLFLSKTSYAFGLALLLGIMVLPFPLLPRQESVIDGLTIGIPAFFFALLPNKKRYYPGFLKRSLSFAIPTGLIITAAVATYVRIASDLFVSERMFQTGATLLLILMGLWVLIILSRPISVMKLIIILAMVTGLVIVFSTSIVARFLGLVGLEAWIMELIAMLSIGAAVLIEIVNLIHRRIFDEKEKRLEISGK